MRAIAQCSQSTEGCWNCSRRILSHISCGRSTDQDSLVGVIRPCQFHEKYHLWFLLTVFRSGGVKYDLNPHSHTALHELYFNHHVAACWQLQWSTALIVTTGLQPSLTHKLYCFSFYPSPPRSNWINGNRINQGNIETNYPSFELSNGILMTSFWFMKDIFTDHNGRLKSNDFLFFICLSAEKVFRAK